MSTSLLPISSLPEGILSAGSVKVVLNLDGGGKMPRFIGGDWFCRSLAAQLDPLILKDQGLSRALLKSAYAENSLLA